MATRKTKPRNPRDSTASVQGRRDRSQDTKLRALESTVKRIVRHLKKRDKVNLGVKPQTQIDEIMDIPNEE